MADVPVLVCTAGELAGQRIPVPEGGIGIGRSPENALVVRDEGVSRYHARLLLENGSLWLQDAGSRNGVFVNGVRVTGHKALKVGDSITIAQHSFELRWQDDLAAQDAALAGASRPVQRGLEDLETVPDPVVGRRGTEEGAPPRRRWYWPFS
jgi:pSer/pThr/pTyr-binding forkhead associated (FHA) protein